jgi:hypothetical protein
MATNELITKQYKELEGKCGGGEVRAYRKELEGRGGGRFDQNALHAFRKISSNYLEIEQNT